MSETPHIFRILAEVTADNREDAGYAKDRVEYTLEEHGYKAEVSVDADGEQGAPALRARVAELEARLDVVHRVPQDNITPAEVRLGQYARPPRTFASDTERALFQIACGLRDTLEETRDQRNAARLLVAGLKERVAELEARLAEYERPADEDPIAYALTEQAGAEDGMRPAVRTDAPDFFQPSHTYTADEPFAAPEVRPNFRCVAIAEHPTKGSRRAFGFEQRCAGAPWVSSSMRDEEWANGWVVTEGGDR